MKYFKFKIVEGSTLRGRRGVQNLQYFKIDEDVPEVYIWSTEKHYWERTHLSWSMWAKKNCEEITEQQAFIDLI